VTGFVELNGAQAWILHDGPVPGANVRVEGRDGRCTLCFGNEEDAQKSALCWQEYIEAIGLASPHARSAAWTFLLSLHPRLGADSPAAVTTADTLQYIAQMCYKPMSELGPIPLRCWCC